jgi:VWFA-related protein
MPAHSRRAVTLGIGALLLIAGIACGQDPADAPMLTLHQDVRLVSIDVLVRGKDGKPVFDLKPEDFTVTENGVAQHVLHAEGHFRGEAAASGIARGTEPAQSTVGPRRDTPGSAAEGTRLSNRPEGGEAVWNLILLDEINATAGNQSEARKHLWQFIKKLPASQPIALAAMGGRLRVLTPFQAGAGGIDKVLAAGAANPQKPLLAEEYNPDDEAILEHIQARMPDKGAAQRASMAIEGDMQLGQRVGAAITQLSDLTQWLGSYPGRKNVFWLSTGFPLISAPHSSQMGGRPSKDRKNISNEGPQTALDQQMQLAHVSVFPIDVRGVLGDYPAMRDATHNSGLYVGSAGAQKLSYDMDQFAKTQDEEIAEELQIAEDTGGIAEYNRNDIAGMLENAYENSQSYYAVTYSPVNKKWDGGYRKTGVSVNRKGASLSYRGGYYAVDAPRPPKSLDDFTLALRKGAPPATGVLFTANLKKMDNKLQLDYVVDVHTLQFSSGEDVRMGGIDCAVVEYDRAGKMMGTAQIHVDGKTKLEEWGRLEQTGFPAHQEVPLLPDMASVVIGIRDHTTGEFGNMEVSVRP